MSQNPWDAGKMLNVSIHNYLLKKGFNSSAEIFHREANVSSHPVDDNVPEDLLSQWWAFFWDLYISRINSRDSAATTYIQIPQNLQQPLQHNEQQQFTYGAQLMNVTTNILAGTDPLMGQSLMNFAGVTNQPSSQLLHDTPSGMTPEGQGSIMDMRTELNPNISGSKGMLLAGNTGSSQGGNNWTLDGWSLPQQSSGSRQQEQLNQQEHPNKTIPSFGQYPNPLELGNTKSVPSGSSMPTLLRPNQQIHIGTKRKQQAAYPTSVSSTININTLGHLPGSALSTPLTDTHGDCMPAMQHTSTSSKPMMALAAIRATDTLASPSHKLVDKGKGVIPNYVESLSSQDNTNRWNVVASKDVNEEFSFKEVKMVQASTGKVTCCDFSFDGMLLATGGHDKKAVIWYSDGLKLKSIVEEHTGLVTDVRFSYTMPRFGTSSVDQTVRVWDVENPGHSLRTFIGHAATVTSVDFHPTMDDLICSCDTNGEIRYWNIYKGSCPTVFKGATSKVRFQPRLGKYLVAIDADAVSIIDVETQACLNKFQGHTKQIHSVCWDTSGELLASVSEDLVQVWKLGSGAEGKCIHQVDCMGEKFRTCVFHPQYSSLMIIGCDKNIELWNMAQNKMMTLPAHQDLIADMAVAPRSGLVASVSHDAYVKLWG